MLLKMIAGLSGPLFNLKPGDEYEFGDDEAARLIDAGFATEATGSGASPTAAKRKAKADVVSTEGHDPAS
ncbi:hypothetical protein [Shinella sp. M31]|uniref:hypothetical protein n=1 Tax=Shinella sp. M31 TaxID=3368615 RepID=UPI003BA16A30